MFGYLKNMKYYIIYVASFLLLTFLWFSPLSKSKSFAPVQVDSTVVMVDTLSSRDVAPQKMNELIEKKDIKPQVIYVEEKPKGILDFTNEIITLIVGIANIVVLIIQLKKKKSTP